MFYNIIPHIFYAGILGVENHVDVENYLIYGTTLVYTPVYVVHTLASRITCDGAV